MGRVDEKREATRYCTTYAQVLRYIQEAYQKWIIKDYGFYNISNEIIQSNMSDRFVSCKMKQPNNTEEEAIIDSYDHYGIPFKITPKLYQLIGWNMHASPSYENMMACHDVMIHDIAIPTKNIIARELHKYDPQFTNENGKISYNQVLDLFLQERILVNPDLINKKMYLIVKKS